MNILPMTTTRCARRCTRYVIGGGHLAKVKPLARRKERRNRRVEDARGNFDWTPTFRGVTGYDVC